MRTVSTPRAALSAVAATVTLAVVVGPVIAATTPTITAAKGTAQSAKVSTVFKKQLSAHVVGTAGKPAVGLLVRFTAPTSGASATFNGKTSAVRKTNKNGNAKVVATANSHTGSYKVTANLRTHPVAKPAMYSLTNTP